MRSVCEPLEATRPPFRSNLNRLDLLHISAAGDPFAADGRAATECGKLRA
jgi:hypothetical protein